MKANEIRDLSGKEREDKVSDLREELFNLRFQVATGKIENPGRLRLLRRDIARVKTIQKEMAAKQEGEKDEIPQAPAEKA